LTIVNGVITKEISSTKFSSLWQLGRGEQNVPRATENMKGESLSRFLGKISFLP